MKKRFSLYLTAASAILATLSIILGKFLAINLGESVRISFENLPIIFAGVAFGPVVGACVGAVADLVGCLAVGYVINPLITLGAVAIGAVSGLSVKIFKKLPQKARIAISIFLSHIVGSIFIKTIGISVFYGTDFLTLLISRTAIYLVISLVEYTIVYILAQNKGINELIGKLGGEKF